MFSTRRIVRCYSFVQNEVLPDRFIVFGESYRELRELVAEVVIGKDISALTEKVEVSLIAFH